MESDDILSSLRQYSLEKFLTNQDDPYLWVAIAEKYWVRFENIGQQIP